MATSARRTGPSDLDLEFAQFEEAIHAPPAPAGFKFLDFRQIVAVLQANVLFVVAILLAAVGVAVVWTMLQTPTYQASATLQVNAQSDRVLEKGDDISATAALDPAKFQMTQMGVLKSRSLAERVELSTAVGFHARAAE